MKNMNKHSIKTPFLKYYHNKRYNIYKSDIYDIDIELIEKLHIVKLKIKFITQAQKEKKVVVFIDYKTFDDITNQLKYIIEVINISLFDPISDLLKPLKKLYKFLKKNDFDLTFIEYEARTGFLGKKFNKWCALSRRPFYEISKVITE